MPRDFRTRATIDARGGDARDLRVRGAKRDLNGEIIGGRDQLTGETVAVPGRVADPLSPAMGAGMSWLKAQDRMRQAKQQMAGAAKTGVETAGAALNAISPMTAGAVASRGLSEKSVRMGSVARSSEAAPRPDYRNDAGAGVTKYGFVGRAAEVRNRLLNTPNATTAAERRALNPGAGNLAAVSGLLSATDKAANVPKPTGEAAFRPNVGQMLADEGVKSARRRLASTQALVPAGAPVVNEGAGKQIVTRQPASDFRRRSRVASAY